MICRLCQQDNKVFVKSKFYCVDCLPIKRKEWKHKYAKSERATIKRRLRDRTEVARAKYRRYRSKEHYRLYSSTRYHLMDENKRKARYTVSNAVRDGRLIRPNTCQKCGIEDWGTKRSMIEANHYKGYEPENWLEIQWLCTNCHKVADGFIKDGDVGKI